MGFLITQNCHNLQCAVYVIVVFYVQGLVLCWSRFTSHSMYRVAVLLACVVCTKCTRSHYKRVFQFYWQCLARRWKREKRVHASKMRSSWWCRGHHTLPHAGTCTICFKHSNRSLVLTGKYNCFHMPEIMWSLVRYRTCLIPDNANRWATIIPENRNIHCKMRFVDNNGCTCVQNIRLSRL